MKPPIFHVGPALLLLVCAACGSCPPPAETTPCPPAPAPQDPDPLHRLKLMSDLLGAAETVTLRAAEVHERNTDDGKTEAITGSQTVVIHRPDRLYISAQGTGYRTIDHELFYDGQVLTVESHVQNIWAAAAVPPTIDEMLDEVAWRFNLPISLADMIYSAPYDALVTEQTQIRFVGVEVIDGRRCDRFAAENELVDWEIWISQDGDPLPRRLDIVHKTMDRAPRSKIEITDIALGSKPDEAQFVFTPKKEYSQIPVVEKAPPEPEREPASSADAAPESGADNKTGETEKGGTP